MSNPLLDGFDLLTHGEAADGFVSVSVRALRDLVALARASAAGLEAGRTEQAAKLSAWEPVVRAACEYVIAHDARTVVLSKTLDTWRETRRLDLAITALLDSGRALAPEHRPAAGGGA